VTLHGDVAGLTLLGQFFSRSDNPVRELMTTQIVPTQVRPEVPPVGYNCSQSPSLPYQDLTDAYMEIKSDVRALKMEFKWVGTETQNGADARRLDPLSCGPSSCGKLNS